MFFVSMLIEALKVKDHSVGAIFFPPYEYVRNDFITTMGGGLNHTFRGEFLSASIMFVSVADFVQLVKIFDRVLYQNQFSSLLQ